MDGHSNYSLQNRSNNPYIIDTEFISLLNGLSNIIKEYYKSTKQNLTEASSFYNLFESQEVFAKNISNEILKNNSLEKINDLIQRLEQLNQTKKNLEKTNKSMTEHLYTFLEKAKNQFKKMKDMKNKKNQDSINENKDLISSENSSKNNILFKIPIEKKIYIRSGSQSPISGNINDPNLNRLTKNIIFFLKKYDEIKDNLFNPDENLQIKIEELDFLQKELKLQIDNILIRNNKNYINETNLESSEKEFIIKQLKENLKKHQEELMKKEKEINDLNKQLRDFVNENKKLSLESYNNKTMSQNTLNDTIKAYKQQIALLNMEISDKKHLEEVNRNLEYELSKLKNEIILSHEENYEGQIQELREDNKVLRDEINKLRNEILQKNRNMKNIENKNTILQQQIDENSENIQNKESVIVNLTESSIENNDKMNNINHQLLSARETINLLKKKKYEYENEIDKLKDNLNIYNQNEIQLNKTR